jgi:phenylacetate-CoA ligase
MKIEKLVYNNSPVFFQDILSTFYGYKQYNRKFGRTFELELVNVVNRESFNSSQWEDFQIKELRRLLLYAYRNVEFYYEKYRNHNLSESFLENIDFDKFRKIPFLEKEELRKFGSSKLLSKEMFNGTKIKRTSGSTGTPLSIYWTREMEQKWAASFERRIRNLSGVNKDSPRGMIGGQRILSGADVQERVYRINYYEKQIYFSAYHINEKNLNSYIEGLEKIKLEYITGYASANFYLAKLLCERGYKLPYPLKAVILSSEKLTIEMKEMIESVYQCRVVDSYGMVEACASFTENEFGELMDNPDVGYTEFLNDTFEKNSSLGEIANIVCTGFLNYKQPLIRYKIGDSAKLSYHPSLTCGRHFKKIEEVIGRNEDLLETQDGRKMVRFHSVYLGIDKIKKGQIVQTKKNKFILKLETTSPLNLREKNMILDRVISQLGQVYIEIVELDQIAVNENGKFKSVVKISDED